MNKNILNIEVQDFINNNLDIDITKLILKGSPFDEVSSQELATQILSKCKSKKKLPTWFNSPDIYYPNKLNIEQTSSEVTAKYKSSLIQGGSLLDLSGGFGVDSYYFSKVFSKVMHCEIDTELHEIVNHNFKILKANINTLNVDGINYLDTVTHFDWVYLDPSRRNDKKGKVFLLNDCLPNIPENIELLFSKTKNILVKTSPLLDIKAGIKELTNVKEIYSIAVNNEVKELLWIIEKGYEQKIMLKAINIKKDITQYYESFLNEEINLDSVLGKTLFYLYEPNASIMKIGAFNSICSKFSLIKLDFNTHLYTSEKCFEHFPGRIFKIEKVLPYNKKSLKIFEKTKANVATRNFSMTVKEIRKKHKILDGGNTYLFFTTNQDKKVIVAAKQFN